MTPRINHHFLEAIERLLDGDPAQAADTLARSFDEASLWELLRRHRLHNLAACRLKEPLERLAARPTRLLERLDAHRSQQAAHQAKLSAALEEILRIIPAEPGPIFLKGFVLSSQYYESPLERYQSDLDVLVRQDRFADAFERLRRAGFSPKRKRATVRRQTLRTEHGMTLRRDNVAIDLHWLLRNAPAYAIDHEAVWNERRYVTLENGVKVPALSATQELLLLCLSIAHDIGRGGGRLKHLVDLHLVVSRLGPRIDWEAYLEQRHGDNTIRPCANALALALALFDGGPRCEPVRSALERREAMIVTSDRTDALRLVDNERGAVENCTWFCRVYPVRPWRDVRWYLDRQFPHVGRVPVAMFRAARFTWRLVRHQATQLSGRRSRLQANEDTCTP